MSGGNSGYRAAPPPPQTARFESARDFIETRGLARGQNQKNTRKFTRQIP